MYQVARQHLSRENVSWLHLYFEYKSKAVKVFLVHDCKLRLASIHICMIEHNDKIRFGGFVVVLDTELN